MQNYNGQTLTPSLSHWRGSKFAFTLAEVLITLVIIGVIAAITVPTLITKYQKEQTVTRLKKAYSALSQTTNRAIADNGPINTWNILSEKDFAEKYMLPYLSVNSKDQTKLSYSYRGLNGNAYSSDLGNYKFALNDGSIVGISFAGNQYVNIRIDINGKQKPNIFGKDIFRFEYGINNESSEKYYGKFVPTGIELGRRALTCDYSACCNKNALGDRCSAVIMADGWRIADDYPW